MFLKQLTVGFTLAILSLGVNAEDIDDDEREEEFELMIGGGLSNETSIYKGGENGSEFMPFISAEWGPFFLEGANLGVQFYGDEHWDMALSFGRDGAGDSDRGKSPELSDMTNLRTAIVAELEAAYEAEWGEMQFTVARDVSGEYSGLSAGMSYSYPFMLGQWRIEPGASLEWHSKEINQYYYGVSSADARPDRALYNAGSGLNYGVELSAIYPLTPNHLIRLSTEFTQYSSAVKDSPIVDRSTTSEFGIGYIYRF